jgi:hypothetical protein
MTANYPIPAMAKLPLITESHKKFNLSHNDLPPTKGQAFVKSPDNKNSVIIYH